jgi:hypothetical protein
VSPIESCCPLTTYTYVQSVRRVHLVAIVNTRVHTATTVPCATHAPPAASVPPVGQATSVNDHAPKAHGANDVLDRVRMRVHSAMRRRARVRALVATRAAMTTAHRIRVQKVHRRRDMNTCTRTHAGYYGADCSTPCRMQCAGGECDRVFGYCVCAPGRYGQACDKPCPPFTYGRNCRHECTDCDRAHSTLCDAKV